MKLNNLNKHLERQYFIKCYVIMGNKLILQLMFYSRDTFYVFNIYIVIYCMCVNLRICRLTITVFSFIKIFRSMQLRLFLLLLIWVRQCFDIYISTVKQKMGKQTQLVGSRRDNNLMIIMAYYH